MPYLFKIIIGLIGSYLIGSIPTAYIFGRLYKGIDIRQHGSGNIGATNTFRIFGKIPGSIVLIIDILKGVVATSFVAQILGLEHVLVYVLLGIASVIGHNWTIFLNFKGGKGIATSLGVLIGLTIQEAALRSVLLWTVAVWLLFFLTTGYVSLSSIIAAVFLPMIMAITSQPFAVVLLGVIFCIFVVVRHQPNIKRLLNGQEHKVRLPFHKN